mmetsp:Transcript_71125/g.143170  ORF Transcript_71125/g.143170 Transcript_71125/m.143170 type:complete len:134 (+) Transcript_71125:1066-1467(+)
MIYFLLFVYLTFHVCVCVCVFVFLVAGAKGAEFWAKNVRITARPLGFWQHAMDVAVSGKNFKRFGHAHSGVPAPSLANEAGYCFESVWHALLGERLYNFRPAFQLIEDLPRVDFSVRCRESARTTLFLPACAV